MKKLHAYPSMPDSRDSAFQPYPAGAGFAGTWLVYTGLFLLAAITIVMVHEAGHFMAFRLQGYEQVTIRFNMFMGVTSSPEEVRTEDMPLIILGGTIFNLFLAAISSLSASKVSGVPGAALKMYGAHAFLIEGVVILAGFFVDETVTDFSWLVYYGVPGILVGCLGLVFCLAAGMLLYSLWGDIGGITWTRQAAFCLPVAIYILAGAAAASAVLPITPGFIKRFMLAGFILLTVFLVLLVFLYPLARKRIKITPNGSSMQFSMRAGLFWMLSGIGACALSFLAW